MQPKQLNGFTYAPMVQDHNQLFAMLREQQKAKALAESQPQKTQGRGGFLTSLISEAGGTGGAVGGAALGASLGSVVPGIGTAIGGLAGGLIGGFGGGFGGRAVENKVRDDEFQLDKALQEGAMSGAFGAIGGLGHGVKAAKALGNVSKLDDAILAAQGLDDVATGSRASMGQIKAAMDFSKGASKAAGLATGQGARAQAFGIKQGQKIGGEVIDPARTKELLSFIDEGSVKYVPGGVKAGTPQAQANAFQALHNNVTQALTSTLDDINRPLVAGEKSNLIKSIQQAITKNPNITTKQAKNADVLIQQIQGAPDLKALEMVRRSADDLIYTNAGVAGSSAKAAQGQVVRGAIDDFITPLSDSYKAIKGDYSKSRQLIELAAKNAGSAKGAPIPFFGGALKAPVTGLESRGAELLGRVSGGLDNMSGAAQLAKPLVRGTLGRGAANQMIGGGEVEAQDPFAQQIEDPNAMQGIDQSYVDPMQGVQQPQTQGMGITPEQIQQAMVEDLYATGGKNISKLKTILEVSQSSGGGTELTSGAINTVSEFDNSLSNLDEVERIMQSQSGAFSPIAGRIRSLNPYDKTAGDINQASLIAAQNIGRALEGGKLTDADIARYRAALPNITDTPALAQSKIDRLRMLIGQQRQNYLGLQSQYGRGNGGGGINPSGNIEDAIMSAQQQTQGGFY